MNTKNYMMCDFVAKEYGAIAGVLYSNIEFWLEKNRANHSNFYENKYWTYNSIKAFSLLFPMFTEKQIRVALSKMIEGELILKGNFNKISYDRTSWYSINYQKAKELKTIYIEHLKNLWIEAQNEISREGKSSSQEGETILPKGQMTFSQEGEPIPYINTYINTDSVCTQTKKKEEPYTPIDNSYYDITTNTYTDVKPNKWEKFCDELCRISSKYLGGTATYIRGIHSFRSQENYEKLQALFNNCKYDIFKCVELAEKEAENSNIKYRWTDFLKCLGIYANNSYPTENKVESNLQPSHSQSYEDYIREEQERKINKQIELENEAKSKGITVAELEAEHEKEIDKGIDNIKNMLGFGNLSEAIENSNIGIKEVPKGKEYKPAPYTQKELSKEDETQIQDLIKKARENSRRNKS